MYNIVYNIHHIRAMLIPILHSGLGNQLFQFATIFATAKSLNISFGINTDLIIRSSHATIDYAVTIFKNVIEKYRTACQANDVISTHDYITDDMIMKIKNDTSAGNVIGMHGYFQCEPVFRGFRNEITSMLNIGYKTPVIEKAFFIHFRRGDYVNTTFWRDLTTYHKHVIARVLEFEPDAVIYVVSDDIEYCREQVEYLRELSRCVFVEGLNEIETLNLMSRCELGGAAANSTFSWWGLYLNYKRPLLFIPDYYEHKRYGFPEAEFIPTE